jgi:hypothetical protein
MIDWTTNVEMAVLRGFRCLTPLTGDRNRRAQGAVDEAKGKVQQDIGDLRNKAADAIRSE